MSNTTREYDIKQRAIVCSRIDERIEQNVRNRDEIVDSVLSTNR